MKKFFFLIVAVAFSASSAFSQCETFNDGPYTNFGAAPCADPGPATTTLPFEIWKAEAYLMTDVQAGASYIFSACAGTGGTAWDITYTIVAPSGAIDAFGLDGGSICEISFVASESGDYTLIVNEEGNCGATTGLTVDNGIVEFTYVSGGSCDPPVTLCEAGTGDYALTAASVCPGEATELTVTGMSIPNSPTVGGAAVQFSPGIDGTGGLGGVFVITGYDIADFAPYVFDNDVNGILSFNGFPPLAGNWDLQPYVYADGADVFAKCDSVVPSATVEFLTAAGAGCVPVTICEAGILDQAGIDNELCPQETTDYNITGYTLPTSPVAGQYVLEFTPVLGSGAGGPFANDPFVLTLAAPAGTENADVTIVLDNELLNTTGVVQPAMTGEWSIRGGVFTDSAFPCDSVPAVVINFKTAAEFPCGGPAICENPYPEVDPASLAVVENVNGSITFSWDPIPGQLGCQINVVVGGAQSVSQIVGGPTASSFTAPASQLVPFTVYDWRVRCGCQQTPSVIAGPFSDFISIFYGIAPISTDVTPAAAAAGKHTAASNLAMSYVLSNINTDVIKPTFSFSGSANATISQRPSNKEASFDVFPNPSSGAVNLKYAAATEGLVNVRVFDMVGKAVADFNMAVNAGSNFLNLDLSSLDKGIYVIEVLEGQMSSTSKVVMK